MASLQFDCKDSFAADRRHECSLIYKCDDSIPTLHAPARRCFEHPHHRLPIDRHQQQVEQRPALTFYIVLSSSASRHTPVWFHGLAHSLSHRASSYYTSHRTSPTNSFDGTSIFARWAKLPSANMYPHLFITRHQHHYHNQPITLFQRQAAIVWFTSSDTYRFWG